MVTVVVGACMRKKRCMSVVAPAIPMHEVHIPLLMRLKGVLIKDECNNEYPSLVMH
jgi:hypothetical protein